MVELFNTLYEYNYITLHDSIKTGYSCYLHYMKTMLYRFYSIYFTGRQR